MKKTFKKFVSVALSVMLCATAVPASFVAANAAGGGTVTPKVASADSHTVVLKSDGTVWATGSNYSGQLGVGSEVPNGSADDKTPTFTQCVDENGQTIQDAKDVACGYRYTAIIRGVNNEVWQCGSNSSGQLGNNSTTKSPAFVKSSNITNAKELAKGNYDVYHTMALCIEEDGSYALYGVGKNASGQLGVGDYNSPVTTFEKSTTISNIGVYIASDIENITNIENIKALGERKSRNVTGAGQFIGGYRLDVEWSNLQYTYTATWNVGESKWDGSWTAADGGDQIVVNNYSATPCKAEFAFSTNDEFKSPIDGQPGTKGTFADPKVTDEPALDTTTNIVPLAVYTATTPATSQKTVKLGIEGIPNSKAGTNIADATTVGIVTVTLKSSDA